MMARQRPARPPWTVLAILVPVILVGAAVGARVGGASMLAACVIGVIVAIVFALATAALYRLVLDR